MVPAVWQMIHTNINANGGVANGMLSEVHGNVMKGMLNLNGAEIQVHVDLKNVDMCVRKDVLTPRIRYAA